MKKLFSALLIISICLLSACSDSQSFKEGTSCEEIMNAVVEVTEHPQSDKVYLKAEDNLDTYSLSLWADGLYQECEEFELLFDYAIFVSAGTTTYEVAVLKADKKENVEKVKDLINRRKETLSLGDKGMYDPDFQSRMSNSQLKAVGEYVIFIVTDDNDAALDAIEQFK